MTFTTTARRLVLTGTALLLTACGAAAPGRMPVAVEAGAFEAAAAVDGVQIAFNDTYLERIDLNEPLARKNPRNTDKNLLKLIKGAKTSIDGAFYDIEDLTVAEAFVRAKRRGVKVRLVTDTDNMVEKADPTKPRKAIMWLLTEGVPIVDDKRSGIMHHKFMVVDGKTVWTGSTNLTPTSLYCHNNNAVTIPNARLAAAFDGEFERLFTRREFGKSQRGETPPTERIPLANGATVQAFFSPAGHGREAVVAEVKAAKKQIKFLTFSLTDPETGEAMVDRAAAGVKIHGVFDRWLAAGAYSLFTKFKAAKFDVRKDGNEALMHHKVLIVDDATVITGSYNYSQNAEENNNEAFLIFRGAKGVNKAFSGEFDRIRHASVVNHPPPHKDPDSEKKTGEGP
jgi:phosphatidylserine/phosphatidylglycerophosphate/cardiolipin synthase-like enzyme